MDLIWSPNTSKLDRKAQIYKKKGKKNQPDQKVRLIFTHHWIRQSKKFLEKNEKAKDMGENIQIAYKQPKNIKQLVGGPSVGGEGGRGEGRVENDAGCTKCTKKCHACKVLVGGTSSRVLTVENFTTSNRK